MGVSYINMGFLSQIKNKSICGKFTDRKKSYLCCIFKEIRYEISKEIRGRDTRQQPLHATEYPPAVFGTSLHATEYPPAACGTSLCATEYLPAVCGEPLRAADYPPAACGTSLRATDYLPAACGTPLRATERY